MTEFRPQDNGEERGQKCERVRMISVLWVQSIVLSNDDILFNTSNVNISPSPQKSY